MIKNLERSFLQIAKILNLKQSLILPDLDFLEFAKLEKGKFIRILICLTNCHNAHHYGTYIRIQLRSYMVVNAQLAPSTIKVRIFYH